MQLFGEIMERAIQLGNERRDILKLSVGSELFDLLGQ